MPSTDQYLLSGTAAQWTAILEAGAGWGNGTGHVSPDNVTTILVLDSGLTLRGKMAHCTCIIWDNGSFWVRLALGGITHVHLIAMNHLDVGYNLHNNQVATQLPGFITNVLNTYFHTYFPRAVNVSKALRAGGGPERLVYTTHGWLVHLFLHCPESLTLAGIPLVCPTPEDIAAFKLAVAAGDIVWHAGAFNAEYEAAFNEEQVALQFRLSFDLADELGVARPRTLSLRDVPGTTRALVPILRANNITALSIGVNDKAPAPAMPNPGVWLDPASGASVLYMQTSQGQGYPAQWGPDPVHCGGMCRSSCVVVDGLAHAMCWAFRLDNSGPPESADEVLAQFEVARFQFPGATVFASTYDNFTAQLEAIRPRLPVTTAEVGDTWMTSTTADPWKMIFYREAARAYSSCVASALCNPQDARLAGFSRMLMKLTEHTGGFPGFLDKVNWTNTAFHRAIASGEQAYVDALTSYLEQRDIAMREGMRFLADHPLAAEITARMAALLPAVPDVSAMVPVAKENWAVPTLVRVPKGSVVIGLDGVTGALTQCEMAGMAWADESHPLAQFIYRTYNATDFDAQQKICCFSHNESMQAATDAQQTTTMPTMTGLWVDNESTPRLWRVKLELPELQHSTYGAPSVLWMAIYVSDDASISIDLQAFNKTSTRLGEALFVRFLPPSVSGHVWTMDKLGSWVDPLDTVRNGSLHQHGVRNGVVYMSDRFPDSSFFAVDTLDAYLVNPITDAQPATMFPMPLEPLTGPVRGFDVQLMQNTFNTNMPQFSLDPAYRWRFTLRAAATNE
jgi:hypothetical protein